MRVGHVKDPGEGLENQLQCELELAAIVCGLDFTEIAGSQVRADPAGIRVAFKLSVIEGVEGLCAELHAEPLGESEAFVERQVKVIAPRTADRIESQIAVAIGAGEARRRSEYRGAKPLPNSFRIRDGPRHVGTSGWVGGGA